MNVLPVEPIRRATVSIRSGVVVVVSRMTFAPFIGVVIIVVIRIVRIVCCVRRSAPFIIGLVYNLLARFLSSRAFIGMMLLRSCFGYFTF